jgi:hypothetical protein
MPRISGGRTLSEEEWKSLTPLRERRTQRADRRSTEAMVGRAEGTYHTSTILIPQLGGLGRSVGAATMNRAHFGRSVALHC